MSAPLMAPSWLRSARGKMLELPPAVMELRVRLPERVVNLALYRGPARSEIVDRAVTYCSAGR